MRFETYCHSLLDYLIKAYFVVKTYLTAVFCALYHQHKQIVIDADSY